MSNMRSKAKIGGKREVLGQNLADTYMLWCGKSYCTNKLFPLTSLIENKELDPGQIGLFHLEQIVQPAGRGDDNLNSTLKGGNLGKLIATTIAANSPGTTRATKALRLFHDLACKLTGGSENK